MLFSCLSLDYLSHSLVEEILSSISSSSALRSWLVLASHLPLTDRRLVLRSSWNLVATINDWINLMVDDVVLAVLTLVIKLHGWLSSLESWNWSKLFGLKARVVWLERERTLFLHWVQVWVGNIESWCFLGWLNILWLMVVLKCNVEVLGDIFHFAMSYIIILIVIIVIIWDIINNVCCASSLRIVLLSVALSFWLALITDLGCFLYHLALWIDTWSFDS